MNTKKPPASRSNVTSENDGPVDEAAEIYSRVARFTVFWEEFDAYTSSTPSLQSAGFQTLEEATKFARSAVSSGHRVYGIFLGADIPIIDKKRRKGWVSRKRRTAWRHR